MAAVSFVVAGAQKGGTTALDAYLRDHPQVFLPERKELHYFDNDDAFAGEPVDHTTYEQWFDARKPGQIAGEMTPIYMYWEPCAARIQQYNPAMKIIVSLRNPITRAYSGWSMRHARKVEDRDFLDAVRADLSDEPKTTDALRYRSYVRRGRYAEQIERLRRYFPADQLLILRHDDLLDDPNATVKRVTDFLGVGSLRVEPRVVFATPYESRLSPAEWRFLRDVFEPEIRALEAAVGWDCSDWLDEPVWVAG